MDSYVDATHNVEFILSKEAWREDLKKSDEGDVTGYQEANLRGIRATLKTHCAEQGRKLYHPMRCGNPISWRPEVFTQIRHNRKPVQGVVESHLSAVAMGLDVKNNPARDVAYVGLQHKDSGKRVLRINVHPTAGSTRPESSPDNTDSAELNAWKDWSIGQYWLDVISFAAGQMSMQDPGRTSRANYWDVVTLGGDYNGFLDNDERWYYPGAMLPALFEKDQQMKGIDHLQQAHGSDVKVNKRWTVSANSDHNIHLIKRIFIDVPDFARQR